MPFGYNEPMKIPLPLAPSPYFQIRYIDKVADRPLPPLQRVRR
jgi:hypothetical protein